MRTIGTVAWIAVFVACFWLISAGVAWVRGSDSIALSATLGAVLGGSTLAWLAVGRGGWVRGVWRDPRAMERTQRDRERLSRERDNILAAARAKAGGKSA